MKQCKYTDDGYCLRDERNYCYADECGGCDHANISIAVIEIIATCEKTALRCENCGEILTQPKTDCT